MPIHLNEGNQRIKVLENDSKQLNWRKNNQIFEYTGRYILNDDSIIPDTLLLFVNFLYENNVNSLFVDKLSYTYSIKKDVALLTIDRIMFHNDSNIF
jgi:hypothetical protein